MSEAMILVRQTNTGYGDTDTFRAWSEQKRVETLDAAVEQMSKALEGDENAPRPREYEVIEVQVVRRVKVARRVTHSVLVDVTEGVQ